MVIRHFTAVIFFLIMFSGCVPGGSGPGGVELGPSEVTGFGVGGSEAEDADTGASDETGSGVVPQQPSEAETHFSTPVVGAPVDMPPPYAKSSLAGPTPSQIVVSFEDVEVNFEGDEGTVGYFKQIPFVYAQEFILDEEGIPVSPANYKYSSINDDDGSFDRFSILLSDRANPILIAGSDGTEMTLPVYLKILADDDCLREQFGYDFGWFNHSSLGAIYASAVGMNGTKGQYDEEAISTCAAEDPLPILILGGDEEDTDPAGEEADDPVLIEGDLPQDILVPLSPEELIPINDELLQIDKGLL